MTQETATQCVTCGINPADSQSATGRALLWDGKLWRVYPYLGFMTWGPYCAPCAFREVSRRNGEHQHPLFTREQVSAAVNGAADLLPEPEYENEDSIRRDDVINLMVNGALYLLSHPGADVEEVIAASYGSGPDAAGYVEDGLEEGEEMPEEGSERWNELVTEHVLGWVS